MMAFGRNILSLNNEKSNRIVCRGPHVWSCGFPPCVFWTSGLCPPWWFGTRWVLEPFVNYVVSCLRFPVRLCWHIIRIGLLRVAAHWCADPLSSILTWIDQISFCLQNVINTCWSRSAMLCSRLTVFHWFPRFVVDMDCFTLIRLDWFFYLRWNQQSCMLLMTGSKRKTRPARISFVLFSSMHRGGAKPHPNQNLRHRPKRMCSLESYLIR